MHDPTVEALKRVAVSDSAIGGGLLPDRIHPSFQGHWLLAMALLRGLNFRAAVSSTIIDGASGKRGEFVHVSVSNLQPQSNGLSWDSLEDALPLPLESADSLIRLLKHEADIENLDQEKLQISGLRPGLYSLLVDDKIVGQFSAAELGSGVNLADFDTPMLAQAKSIDWAADDRGKVAATAFQLLVRADKASDHGSTFDDLTRLQEHLASIESERAKPKSHHFVLSLVAGANPSH